MGKNTTGGSGHKKRKNNITTTIIPKIDDLARDRNNPLEVYGLVLNALGSCRFQVACQKHGDYKSIVNINCSLRGALHKKRRVNKGDYVLVNLFEFDVTHGGIIQVYTPEDVSALKRANRWDFPEEAALGDTYTKQTAPSFLEEDSGTDTDTDESDIVIKETKVVVPSGPLANDENIDTI